MKKLIMMLIALIMGVSGMWADVITNKSQLENTSVYSIHSWDRGYMICVDGVNALCGSNRKGVTFNSSDPNHQWALIKYSGCYFMYNVGQKKFVNYASASSGHTSLTTTPESTGMSFLNSTAHNDTHPLVIAIDGSHQFNMSGDQGNGVLTNWNNTGDNGNTLAIEKIEGVTFDPTEAIEALKPKFFNAEEGATYTIKLANTSLYLNVIQHDTKATILSNTSEEFTFAQQEDGRYYILNSENRYIGKSSNTWNMSYNSPEYWTVESVEGGYVLHCDQGYVGFDSTDANSAAYRDKGSNARAIFKIDKVGSVATTALVTYNYTIGGRQFASEQSEQTIGATVAAPPAQPFTTITSWENTKTVAASGTTVEVELAENLPFTVTTDKEHPTWGLLRMHSNQGYYAYYDTESERGKWTTSDDMPADKPQKYYWYITGNLIDGFQLYNMVSGGMPMMATAGQGYVTKDDDATADANNLWFLQTGTNGGAYSGVFCLKTNIDVTDKPYMNARNGNDIGFWGNSDNGSSFKFVPEEYVAPATNSYVVRIVGAPAGAVAVAIIDNQSYANNTSVTFTGTLLPANVTATNLAFYTYAVTIADGIITVTYTSTLNNQEVTAFTTLAEGLPQLFDADKVAAVKAAQGYADLAPAFTALLENAQEKSFFIYHNARNNGGRYAYTVAAAEGTTFGLHQDRTYDAVYKLVHVENGKYRFQNVKTNWYIGKTQNDNVAIPSVEAESNAGIYELSLAGDGMVAITCTNASTAHKSLHEEGGGAKMVSWGADAGASKWQIVVSTAEEISVMRAIVEAKSSIIPVAIGTPTQEEVDALNTVLNAAQAKVNAGNYAEVEQETITAAVTAYTTTNHLHLPNGYYYMKGMETGRAPYLYNNIEDGKTYHAASASMYNNGLWKVTRKADGTGIEIVNGQGTPLTMGNGTKFSSLTFGAFNAEQYASKGGIYFTEGINLTNSGALVTWTAGGAGAKDNRWTFEAPANFEGVYSVTIEGGDDTATICYLESEYAHNGGFFYSPITVGGLEVPEGYLHSDIVVDEENKTISLSAVSEEVFTDAEAAYGAFVDEEGNLLIGSPSVAARAALKAAYDVCDEDYTLANMFALKQALEAYYTTKDLHLPTGYYYMKNMDAGNLGYAFNDYDHDGNTNHTTLMSTDQPTDNNGIWYIVNNGDGTINITNVGDNRGIQKGNSAPYTTLHFGSFNKTQFGSWGNAGIYFTEGLHASNQNHLKLADGTLFLTGWDHSDSRGSNWTFEVAEPSIEAAQDVAHATLDSYYLASEELIADYSSQIDEATTQADLDAVMTAALQSYQDEVAGKLYFIQSGYPEYEAQQRVKKSIFYNGTNMVWGTFDELNPNHYLTLTITNANKLLIATPEGKYMQGVTGTMGDEISANSAASLRKYEDGTYNIVFGDGTMHTNGHSSGAGVSGNLVNWSGGAATASSWVFVEATEEQYAAALAAAERAEILAELVALINSTRTNYYDDWNRTWRLGNGLNAYGYKVEPTEEMRLDTYIEAAQTFVDNFDMQTNTREEVLLHVSNINTILANLTINLPEPGTFLRVRNANTKGYLSCENGSNNRTAYNGTNDITKIFYYDGQSLLSFKTGYYIGVTNDNFPTNLSDADAVAAPITFCGSPSNPGTYNIAFNAARNRYAYADGNAGNGAVGGMVSTDTKYTFWLEEVTSLPVTIGEAKYNTLYTPVALTVPAGIGAYVCRLDGSTIRLYNVIEDNGQRTIPENTAVLLYKGDSEETNFNMPVRENYNDQYTDNGFEGTPATRSFSDYDGWYSLQKTSTGVGFYQKKSGAPLAGFRAYIHQASSNVRMFTFEMGDGETNGIDTQKMIRELNAATFDLSGRMISNDAKTTRGLYIQNGKKILK